VSIRWPSPIRVLHIEDDRIWRDLVRDTLSKIEDTQFELVDVRTLAEGIATLMVRSFHLVLLDLKLPNSKGVETLKRLLAARIVPPVVVLTGAPDEETYFECMLAGAQKFLPKEHIKIDSLRRVVLGGVAAGEGLKALVAGRIRAVANNLEVAEYKELGPDDLEATQVLGINRRPGGSGEGDV
jgi:DNA-binding NarL/FixJ family response regulator